MTKPDLLVNLRAIIETKWRWFGSGKDLDRAIADFNLTRWNSIIDRSFGSSPNDALDPQHELRANIVRSVDNALDNS